MPLIAPPQLADLDELAGLAAGRADVSVVCWPEAASRRFPVHCIAFGNPSPEVPAIGIFGGVHGLERVGADVVLGYLRNLLNRLPWDTLLHRQLERLRMVFIPIVNPGGLWLGTRANPNGVDLMRNAPIESPRPLRSPVAGQRVSARLPWFRGIAGAPMEPESEAVCRTVEAELLTHRFSLSVDCHSGFGVRDRIWFPYAHSTVPVPHLPELLAFSDVLDRSHPHHRYVFEPQSHQYLANGDLWDHLYACSLARGAGPFLPLTLEMGSWLWVRKNPRQFLSRQGFFNPLIQHRLERALRRHIGWLDFVARVAYSHDAWRPSAADRASLRARAHERWYRGRR